MRDILLTLIVFGAIPIVFMRPWTGILLFSWISYMNPHRLTWGFAYEFQFAMIAAVTTILAFMIGRERKSFPLTPVTISLIVFILWTCVTTAFALADEPATDRWIQFVKIQIMTFLTLAMINTRQRLYWLLIVIVASLAFYGVRGGVFSIVTGGNYRVWGPAESFFEDNNHVALTLVMTLPLLHFLQMIATRRLVVHFISVVMLLTLAAIIGTYSRGALIGLAAMGLSLLVRSHRKFPIMIGATICLIGVLAFMPQKWFDRMNTLNADVAVEDTSAAGRIDAWVFSINVANDRIVGGGFKVHTKDDLWPIYNPEATKPRAPHSIYFEVLGEHGWIGIVIFLFLGLATLFQCGATIKLARGHPEVKWAGDLSRMLQVSLIGYAANGLTLNVASFDLYYHLVAIAVQANLVAKYQVKAAAARSPAGEAGPAAAGYAPSALRRPGPATAAPPERAVGLAEPQLGGRSGYLIKK